MKTHKLNLGCGKDLRVGYFNIDLANLPSITRGDARQIDVVPDGTVDEIVAIRLIQHIAPQELPKAINHWKDKLMVGGTMYIQSLDYNLLFNHANYDRIDILSLNQMLFQSETEIPNCGIYNLINTIALIENAGGFEIIEKGYSGYEFFVKVRKV